MRIALIGPGIMPIPPQGWGAVEMLIWDYYSILTKNGIDVDIINTPNREEIIEQINSKRYEAVHLHYDVFYDILSSLKCKTKIISSHYPFINNPEKYSQDGYREIFSGISKNIDFHIFSSSEKDIKTFISGGADPEKIHLSRLGVKSDSYNFIESPVYNKTLCFSQIVERKRQYCIQYLENIDFFGRLDDPRFINLKNYKGEVKRDFLNDEITKYPNFVLLSSVENTTPLAVKEALISGLGVVVSESVSYELDIDKEFICIIPENKINDTQYIQKKIIENSEISKKMRNEIRQYAIKKFDVENILMGEYLIKIKEISCRI